MKREVHLRELRPDEQLDSEELQVHVRGNPPAEDRFRFAVLAKIGDSLTEVGFLATEVDLVEDRYVMYEIFIAKKFQLQGIGTAVVNEACKLARKHNYSSLFARPGKIANWTTDRLLLWYRSLGFTDVPNEPGLLYRSCVPAEE